MNNKELAMLDTPKIISLSFSVIPAIGQCDACSPIPMNRIAPSYINYSQTRFYHIPPIVKQPVNAHYHAILSPSTHTFSALNESALHCLQAFSTPTPLSMLPGWLTESYGQAKVRSVVEQMQQLGLLVPENDKDVKAPKELPKTLGTWLHVTNRCNLSCAYCYVPHRAVDMSLETGKAAVEAAYRSAIAYHYQEVKFKYAGGEPLLRFDLIQELHQYARQLIQQHPLKLDGVVISNGTLLTRTMVKDMLTLGLRLTISLDAVKGGVQRMYPDGRDSSEQAMQGIETALESGLIPNISITVSNSSVGQLPELLEWVLARELPFSLNFYRPHCDSTLETGKLKLDEDSFISGILAAYKVIEANLPQRSLLASLADMANFAAPHLRRCSVGHSYLVFDTEGRVSKCQMQMDTPVTDMSAEDPLAAVRADSCGIQNVTVDEKEGCQDCQWKYWCGGGCPLETYRMTGKYDVKSPNCNIYKTLYPEVIRLEGLRLLSREL